PIKRNTNARKGGSKSELARSQTETPIRAPAAKTETIEKRALAEPVRRTVLLSNSSASRIGNAVSESGKSRMEFQLHCGANAARNPAIVPTAVGRSSNAIST